MKKQVTRLGILITLLILILYLINVLTTSHVLLLKKSPSLGRVEQRARIDVSKSGESVNAAVQMLHGNFSNSHYGESLFRQDVEGNFRGDAASLQNHINTNFDSSTLQLHIPYKLVHLDLKGAPPRLEYLKSILPLIESAGGNGILLEYEDTFPYQGELAKVSKNPYSTEDLQDFLKEAAAHNLEVIPLVQTLGHMEFVLKKKQFMADRENKLYPQSICPSRNSSWGIITSIIDNVMSLHKTSNYIHIGCDEVYQIGECSQCRLKDTKKIFLDHVIRVATYVKSKYPKINVIIWDDMLRKYYNHELQDSDIGKYVEIMIWDYTEDVDHLIPPYIWPMYTSTFPHIWAASAYKGAFGEKLYNVDINRHALNHVSWLKTLTREQNRIKNFRGIALTGWSRYDHFGVLCELLPVAIPSLLFNLLLLKNRDVKSSAAELGTLLKCDITRIDDELRDLLGNCVWNGDRLYRLMKDFGALETQITESVSATRRSGWFSDWQIRHNYTNTWRLISQYNDTTRYLHSLHLLESNMKNELEQFYGDMTVREWIGTVIWPLKTQLEKIITDIRALGLRLTWD